MLKMLSNIYVDGGSCSINFTSTSLEILLENPQPPSPLFQPPTQPRPGSLLWRLPPPRRRRWCLPAGGAVGGGGGGGVLLLLDVLSAIGDFETPPSQ